MKKLFIFLPLIACSQNEGVDSKLQSFNTPWIYESGQQDYLDLKNSLTPYSEAKKTGRYNILFRGLDNESRGGTPGADSIVVLSININPNNI